MIWLPPRFTRSTQTDSFRSAFAAQGRIPFLSLVLAGRALPFTTIGKFLPAHREPETVLESTLIKEDRE